MDGSLKIVNARTSGERAQLVAKHLAGIPQGGRVVLLVDSADSVKSYNDICPNLLVHSKTLSVNFAESDDLALRINFSQRYIPLVLVVDCDGKVSPEVDQAIKGVVATKHMVVLATVPSHPKLS